ncbi:pentraxin fusion protein-like [Mixophyes fleayi]|uniref:pentraxin fusion protein-like n=1 Tax=Mixophyes fleayi TaxID=3061075 RepID=UPI003F4D8155
MRSLIVLFVWGLIEGKEISKESCILPRGVNLASYGSVSQSSNYGNVDLYRPERAVDGIIETNSLQYPCTHTDPEREPWWEVDLGNSYAIGTVVVINRGDCCADRLIGVQVRIGDSPYKDNPICATIYDVSQSKITFTCSGMKGRYVTFILSGKSGILSLCEVSLYRY